MKKIQRIAVLILTLGSVNLAFPDDTYAYLDPGTGSFFIQTLLAVLFGALVGIRMFWKNIKSFFSRRKEKKDEQE